MTSPQKSLSLLKAIIFLSVVILSVFTVWRWLFPESLSLIDGGLGLIDEYGGMERLSWWQRLAGFATDAIPAALMITALVRLHGLLRAIEVGNWFDEACESAFRSIGHLMLWHALAAWLHDTVLILVLTGANEPGQRVLSVSVASGDFLALIPALMALVIAEMVRRARAQRDELNQII